MDSAYKNQVFTMLSKTIGNNKNSTSLERNSIFLLLQYICDIISKYENTISKLDTTLDKINNCITDNGNVRVDFIAIDNKSIGYYENGSLYGNVNLSIYNQNL